MFLVNLSQDKSNINPYLSNTLLDKIKESLDENKKIILYINKRWDYSSLICSDCNYLYKCKNCDICLSVHKNPEKLICHLCWESEDITFKCKQCGKSNLKKVWVWTEQIESSLNKYFHDFFSNSSPATGRLSGGIFRFDSDSVKNKGEKALALERLEKANIIIGTKMITTWFDFKWVWLIWIILLEQELLIPKYNTEEKVVSNIKQLIWRWWRLWEKSNVVIQTFIPENEVIKNITHNNYKDFFIKTLEERKLFNYPPFVEMLTLEFRDKNKEKALKFMENLKNKLDLNNKKNIDQKEIAWDIEIKLNISPFKKYNQYYYKIIIKWNNLREFLKCIKPEIFRNSSLVVIFE